MAQFLLFICALWSFSWAGDLYTLADLEILAQEENDVEFFQHALDVRPSDRLEAWKSMVTKMGGIYTLKVLQKDEILRKDHLRIEELYSWPIFQKDDIFKVRRQQIGLLYLKTCLKKENSCIGDLKAFWGKDKNDPETAFKLAELTINNKKSPISTWTFLEVSLKSPLSEFYCKKEFVINALWGKIEIDYIRLGPEGDLMKKIDRTVHPDCLPDLISESRKRLMGPVKREDRELAFQILKSQLKTDEAITDFFYTVYLLDNPSQGELFNYSWNRIKELGGSIERREAVLKKIAQLDPLPDEIFSSLDQTKKRVLLNHFKAYFPEYLDFYVEQCTHFFGGKGSFPKGNPTVHCQDFMKSDLAPTLIDNYKIKRYLEVRKI